MFRKLSNSTITLSIAVMFVLCAVGSVAAQKMDGIERGRMKDMLNAVKKEIKGKYYDDKFKGVDIETKFKEAEAKLDKAQSTGQALGIIAQAVMDLNDSHTRFIPPPTTVSTEYGFRTQMIGDKSLVIAVKPKSDAEKQGLKIGDEIVQWEGFRPNRRDMWKVNYYYNILSPRAGLSLKVVSPGDAAPREMNIAAKVTKNVKSMRFEDLIRMIDLNTGTKVEHRFVKLGGTTIWKMPSFMLLPEEIDGIMKGRISQSQNLILDLRGNGGGLVVALERLAGYFVDKDTKIADLKGRKAMDPQMAKTRGGDVYKGKLVILIDSNSGSAAEIFARFMQLQERGVVIGDRSAGAVMQSISVPMQMGVDSIVPYGVSMTNADVIMSDGVSLEHAGVTPHLEVIPTPAQVAAGEDVQLAAALKLLGQDMSPAEAGKLFPFEWEDN